MRGTEVREGAGRPPAGNGHLRDRKGPGRAGRGGPQGTASRVPSQRGEDDDLTRSTAAGEGGLVILERKKKIDKEFPN